MFGRPEKDELSFNGTVDFNNFKKCREIIGTKFHIVNMGVVYTQKGRKWIAEILTESEPPFFIYLPNTNQDEFDEIDTKEQLYTIIENESETIFTIVERTSKKTKNNYLLLVDVEMLRENEKPF